MAPPNSAGYNAGRGSVKKWIERYGDPRDPKVDAVDWVEKIPFSETRNYVQRIMENLQVYRARFGGGSRGSRGPGYPMTASTGTHIPPFR